MAALKNTASMMPPKVYDMMRMLLNPEYDGEDIDAPDYIPFKDEMGNCLSTGQKQMERWQYSIRVLQDYSAIK